MYRPYMLSLVPKEWSILALNWLSFLRSLGLTTKLGDPGRLGAGINGMTFLATGSIRSLGMMLSGNAWQVEPNGGSGQVVGSMIRYGTAPVVGSGSFNSSEKSPPSIAGVGTKPALVRPLRRRRAS